MTSPARRFGRRGTFFAAAAVLALCLWASGAPSVLYPVYAEEWNLTPVVTTAVFATYPIALIVVLLLFGGLSDAIGRRRAMLLGIALITVASVLFAVAPNVGFLFAGRVVQGIGTGFALGAASAALVENNPGGNPRLASSVTTISTSAGLMLALFLSGVMAQLLPLPMVISFALLFVLGIVTFTLIWFTPADTAKDTAKGTAAGSGSAKSSFAPRIPRVAPGILRAFFLSALSVSVSYSVGALVLSLGAQMARQLTGTTNLIVVGGLLAFSPLAIGVTALFLSRIRPHVAILAGAVISLGGLAVMEATAASGSLALLLAWCIIGGIGYSFAFTGGLSLINRSAPAQHRGATLSLVYLVAYFLQAATAVGAGALATGLGLRPAIGIIGPVVAVVCIASIALAVFDLLAKRRAAVPVVGSSSLVKDAA